MTVTVIDSTDSYPGAAEEPEHSRLLDYRNSLAVVMGTWDYTHLPPIPAAGNSLSRMASLLTGPLCGWPPDRIMVVANERSPGELPDRLIQAFENITDIALFYYVGHGVVDLMDDLCLALGATVLEANRRSATSLPFRAVRTALIESPARIKVVILDCCFAGQALPRNTLAGPEDFVVDMMTISGSYVIAATGPYGTAWYETSSDGGEGPPQTFFTRYFADVIETGIPDEGPELRLNRIFVEVRDNLVRDGKPPPHYRGVNTAGDFVFARNAAREELRNITATSPIITARQLAGVCSDTPSTQDLIGATPDVEILADLIAARETSAPLAVALIGNWGAGKSSAMLQIERRVDVLAKQSRQYPGLSAFVANIRQVRFNAWDYSDDRLWAGIAVHLFDALSADPVTSGDLADRPGQSERRKIQNELRQQQLAQRRLENALAMADSTRESHGLAPIIYFPAYFLQVIWAACRELVVGSRTFWVVASSWLVLAGTAYLAWSSWRTPIVAAAAAVAAGIAPVSIAARSLLHWHKQGLSVATGIRGRLEGVLQKRSQKISELRKSLEQVDAQTRLAAFFADLKSRATYQEYRGLLGKIRADLTTLSQRLTEARRQWDASGRATDAPLERIVLYIDDLDRCVPRRVVEVLEAVHLMLALDLFIVVMAVDARWLVKSLDYHYNDLFTAEAGRSSNRTSATDPGQEADGTATSPLDYLDKIFQIPYALTPPPAEALASYIRSLLEPRRERTAPARPPDSRLDGHAAHSHEAETLSEEQPSASVYAVSRVPKHRDAVPFHLRPERLELTEREVQFMMRLGVLLPTPRAAKKLVNLYRLVRISIPDVGLTTFTGSESGGPYQAVQILLALLVGYPDIAQDVFGRLANVDLNSDIFEFFEQFAETGPSDERMFRRIRIELVKMKEELGIVTGIEEYRRWCPILARYSFHTREMLGDRMLHAPMSSPSPDFQGSTDGPTDG